MHNNRVLTSIPTASATPSRRSRWLSLLVLAGSLAGLAPLAQADEFRTVVGAGIGAVTGAYIGQSIGGRNGALVGAGAGGLVGASIAHQSGYATQRQAPVQPVLTGYPYQRGYEPYYPVRAPVAVWQAPPPQRYEGWRQVQHHRPHSYYGHHGHHGHRNDRHDRRD